MGRRTGEEKGGEGGRGKSIGEQKIGSALQFYPLALAFFMEQKKLPPLRASYLAWHAEEHERGDELQEKDN